MGRLTITLDDRLHRALREAALREGRSVRSIIEEGLILGGIRSVGHPRDLVEKARGTSGLSESDAIDVAQMEVSAVRASD